MANNKNNALTEEEKRKRMVALDENRGSATRQQSVYIDSPENTWREVKKTRDQEEREKWLKEYASTPGGIPNGIISRNTAQTVTEPTTLNAESALKRHLSKMPGAVLAPEYEISPDASSGASPSSGDAVRINEPSSPHGSYEEVGADYAANAPYGGILYADGFFVYKDGNGGYYTEEYGKKTPSDMYGNQLTATTQKEQGTGAASDGKETISQVPTVDYDHYYDYAPAGTGASDENTRRTLDEIYNEYLEGAYYKNAVEEGKRLAEDVLGKYAAMTGGMPSTAATYAATAAGQQSDRAAQDYLWGLAQKQFQTEKDELAAESEKYASMIDNYLKMGYGVGDIPDEWWAKSNYDKKYAGGVSKYVGRQNAANASGDEREFYSALLDKYVSGGYDVPDELYARAGYSDEQAAMLKKYVEALGAKNEGKTRDEWATTDYDGANKTADAVLKMYKSGQDWEGYLSSLDDTTAEYIFEYLGRSSPASMRQWERSGKTFVDEFGNEYDESALRAALVRGGMNDKEASAFIKTIK